MKQTKKTALSFALSVFALTACKHSEQTVAPIIANETLTTIQLRFTNNANAADTLTAQWEQLLDKLGNPLTADTSRAIINLKANAVYSCKMRIFDKTQTPVVEITDEIKDRSTYHLYYYQPIPIAPSNLIVAISSTDIPGTPTSPTGPCLNLVVSRTDFDTNNPPLPLGLSTLFTTGAISNGRLRVVMRHQPDAKNGTYAPGSSDFDINFTVNIQ